MSYLPPPGGQEPQLSLSEYLSTITQSGQSGAHLSDARGGPAPGRPGNGQLLSTPEELDRTGLSDERRAKGFVMTRWAATAGTRSMARRY